ncbi:late competence protein ComER [Gorillibacterium massiliense]|uniref:late competence protein ComER n=1 Tax=Gorillibacterium massiliense TaxID=1280390 RepID=UPI0004B8AE55|nr:late competence protein ComER [Gorillibacterium massiliense]
MMTGFIGTGSMGSMLIDAFIRSGVLQPEEIIAFNRTPAKAEALAARHLGLTVATSIQEAAKKSRILFLCVKPSHFPQVVADLAPVIKEEQIVISITSPVMISQLEEKLQGKVAKIIPSITNYMLSGATLCMYGSRIEERDRQVLERLVSAISHPVEVTEQYTRVSSDLTSCGPAFIAFLLQKLVDAAVAETGIARDAAACMAGEMLLGTGMLLTAGGMSVEELQRQVAVPGGITAAGLQLLDREVSDVFSKLIQATHAKYYEDVEKIEEAFKGLTP